MNSNEQFYWNKKFSKEKYFGEGPTGFAKECKSIMRSKNIQDILDLGCGQGRDSIYFSKMGKSVTAFDNSKKALDSITNRNITKIKGDIKSLEKIKNRKFDVIYSNLALHFFKEKDLQSIFNNLHTLLKNGGFLLITVKNKKDKYAGLGEKIEEHTYQYQGVIRHYYTRKELQKLLKKFKILEIKEGFHIMFNDKPTVYWKVIAIKK